MSKEEFVPPRVSDNEVVEYRAYRDSLKWETAIVLEHDHRSRATLAILNDTTMRLDKRWACLHVDDPDNDSPLQRSNEHDQTGGSWRHTQRTQELDAALEMLRELAKLVDPANACVPAAKTTAKRGGKPDKSPAPKPSAKPAAAPLAEPEMDLVS